MKLRVKRAHHFYPGIFLRVGDEITLEPNQLGTELVRRGFFVEVPAPQPEEEKPKRTRRKDDPGTDQS
jgi:hypothetical protein